MLKALLVLRKLFYFLQQCLIFIAATQFCRLVGLFFKNILHVIF